MIVAGKNCQLLTTAKNVAKPTLIRNTPRAYSAKNAAPSLHEAANQIISDRPPINNPPQTKPVNIPKKETIPQKVQTPQTPIAHTQEIPAQDACFGELEKPLPENISAYLQNKKIKFYSHQAEAINKARQGKNVIITTHTASGKTLAFNIPVFDALANDKKATALYIYPSKALTNDQLKVLQEIEKGTGIKADSNVYDGDTPKEQRQFIRENSRIILTNPYGLHLYLPWHKLWRSFFQNLRYIVLDEAHVYRGVFGSNVAMLLQKTAKNLQFLPCRPPNHTLISNHS